MSNGPIRTTVSTGIAWTTLGRATAFVSTACVGVLMTRRLNAADVGLLTLALVASGLIESTTSVGLSRYLVQKRDLHADDADSAFWGDVAFGAFGAVVLASLAPLIARFFEEPDLTPMLWALAATSAITGTVKTQRCLAFRELRFAVVARSEVWSSILAAALAVIALEVGVGAWAIIVRELARRLLASAALWLAVDWRPRFAFSISAFQRCWAFGSRLLLVEILRQLAATADQLVVGRLFGTGPVGIYSRGQSLVLMPLQQVTSIVATVLFPTFSRLPPDQIAREYHRAVGGVLTIFVPVVLAMAFVAEDAVVLVLGERWAGSAVFLQILAPTLLWRSASELLRSVYNAQGRTDLTLKTTVWGQLLTLACIGVGCPFGPPGVAVGVLVGTVSGTLLEQGVAFRTVDLPWRPLLIALRELVLPTAAATALAFATFVSVPQGWLRLLLTTTSIIAGFFLAGWGSRARPFEVLPGPLGLRAKRAQQ